MVHLTLLHAIITSFHRSHRFCPWHPRNVTHANSYMDACATSFPNGLWAIPVPSEDNMRVLISNLGMCRHTTKVPSICPGPRTWLSTSLLYLEYPSLHGTSCFYASLLGGSDLHLQNISPSLPAKTPQLPPRSCPLVCCYPKHVTIFPIPNFTHPQRKDSKLRHT